MELENDANAAAYGEYLVGAGRGSHNVFYVTLGTGIGGAIIIDDELWVGACGFAGEFGHISVLDSAGDMIYLEMVASAPGFAVIDVSALLKEPAGATDQLLLRAELAAATPRMSPRAVIVADDIDWSNGFFAFCVEHGLSPLLFTDNGKDNLRVRLGLVKLDHPRNDVRAITGRAARAAGGRG